MNDFDKGLRMLARMIARAYRQDLAERKSAETVLRNEMMEEKHANQRNQRSHQAAPAGQDPAGNLHRERRDVLFEADGILCVPGRSQKGFRRKTLRTADHVSH